MILQKEKKEHVIIITTKLYVQDFQAEESYPYNGLMLHGKKATEKTNWEADGDNWSLSFSWYETAVQTNDLNPCFYYVQSNLSITHCIFYT